MKKFAVFGNPIAQSLSPRIHSMFATECNVDIEYTKKLAPVDGFEASLGEFFSDPQSYGCNVTSPFKEIAYGLMDEVSPAATLAKAVNTIKKTECGNLSGDNTDGIGLVADLLSKTSTLENKTILLIGAGGAAKGCIYPLLECNIKSLLLVNRSVDKAMDIANNVNDKRIEVMTTEALDHIKAVDIVINSTSASLHNQLPNVCRPSWFTHCEIAYDMAYSQEPTLFMQYAKAQGAPIQLDGLGMLVEQAAAAFTIWTGLKPSTDRVKAELRERC
jgi:shikimate dehydrogenase